MRIIDADELKKMFPDKGGGAWTYNITAKAYIDAAPTVDTWHYPSKGELPTDHATVILYGKLKYEHEKEYEYFIDVGEWLGNMWSSDLERWSTVNDWYEGQQEYKIIAWMPFPEPPKEEE